MWPDLATRLWLLAAALAIEVVAGYPQVLYRAVGHPVTWIGVLIGWLDKNLNFAPAEHGATPHPVLLPMGEGTQNSMTTELTSPLPLGEGQLAGPQPCEGLGWQGKLAGILALHILLAATVTAAIALQSLLAPAWPGLAFVAVLTSTLLATRSLDTHVHAVADALDAGGLPAGRQAVAQIVGRDPEALDEAGVCRAAIESLAENFSDGVVAPALWFLIAGLPGIAAYKAINTADSMIGHKTPRHKAFGWASARLDDLVNLPGSRLSALLLTAASCLLPAASSIDAMKAIWRDAGKHRSPNAGWPEAAMAGALGIQLAGSRSYGGVMSTDSPMGDGRVALTAADIRRALWLYRLAAGFGWGLVLAVVAVSR